MEQNSEAIAGAIAGTNFIFNVVPSTKDKEAKEELKDMNNSFFDLIIIGGSLSGCFTAMSAAKTGAKVILIEERTYLGKEFAADLRPWIKSDLKENLNSKLKDILFDKIDDNQQSVGMWNEIPFFLGQFKKNLLDLLRSSDVTVLFNSSMAGVVFYDNKVSGVMLGNKSGLQVILGKTVVDATENKKVARLVNENIKVRSGQKVAKRTIEYSDLAVEKRVYKVPEELGVLENKVILHPGKKEKSHYFAEFAFEVDVERNGNFREQMQWEIEAKQKSILLCEYLKGHYDNFRDAGVVQTAPEICLPPIFSVNESASNSSSDWIESEKYGNLFILGTDAFLSQEQEEANLKLIYKVSQQMGKTAARRASALKDLPQIENLLIALGEKTVSLPKLNPKHMYDHSLDIKYYLIDVPDSDVLPLLEECNVLVVGGGTSGAPATIAAAQITENVTLIESFSALGGTGTIGGINVYWHGYRKGFTEQLDEKVKEMTKRISADVNNRKWNIEAKEMTYLTEILENRGKILFRTMAVGTISENNSVKGVIALTPDGLGVIKSSITIDATGDGDIAAWAGADYFVADPRGDNMQTFNQCEWKLSRVGLAGVNKDLGVIDITDFVDTTRGIMIGHDNSGRYEFSPYPAVRESRHIQGDYLFTVADILCHHKFDDTIAIGKTDFDQHGLQSSWLARLGYLPYHNEEFEIRMPYRACLPKGIDNLLVTGKAFSASKDAFSFMRMQPDLQNMGYAVGMAAGLSLQNGIRPRELDVSQLQKRLVQIGIIREEDLLGSEDVETSPLESVERLIEGEEKALIEVLCSHKDKVLPLLEKAYPKATSKSKLLLAMALTWFDSKTGIPHLIERLEILKDKNQASKLDSHERPRGGYLKKPSIYWRVNQIIVLLGLSKDKRGLEPLCNITAKTDAGGPPNTHRRLHWRRIPNYDRIISLCFSLERLADKRATDALNSLLEQAYISGHLCKDAIRKKGNYASAFLEVVIARTLARCGGKRGLLILADYLNDVRKVLSNHAYQELKAITNQDFGRNSNEWKRWIKERQDFPVRPFTDSSEKIKG